MRVHKALNDESDDTPVAAEREQVARARAYLREDSLWEAASALDELALKLGGTCLP